MAEAALPQVVRLFVESSGVASVARWALEAAGLPVDRVEIVALNDSLHAGRPLDLPSSSPGGPRAALMDLDARSVPDAVKRARARFGDADIPIFCAVPMVEAWLFADDEAVVKNAAPDEEVRAIVERLPLPEEIPDPKSLARFVFGPPSRWEFFRTVNVQRAAARSPSLRAFLAGMAKLLGVSPSLPEESVARSLDRDVFAGLLAEILPADTIVWRTTSGVYTASDLRREIAEGSEIGRQYASDLLRIARDFLMRKARRDERPSANGLWVQ